MPVVVVGVVRHRAHFTQFLDQHFYHVLGEVDGSIDAMIPSELTDRITPILDQYRQQQSQQALALLDQAIGNGNYTCSISDMWHFAHDGRAQTLIVEQDYSVAGLWDAEHRTFTLCNDPTAPGVTDDIVDELIEMVILKGGEVRFVEQGALKRCSHIAMIVRW